METRFLDNLDEAIAQLLLRIGQLAASIGCDAYVIGGCVRDWILGLPESPDIDIAIEGDGLHFAAALAEACGADLVQHKQFGTSTLSGGACGAYPIDIVTCRKESYAKPGAYPKIERGSIREDLFRRDFTANAMALCLMPPRWGELVDPFKGVEDLKAGQLRVLHANSFRDDPSRILRGIRFIERFGWKWEAQTEQWVLAALTEGALNWLNSGRVEKEFELMTSEPDPARCFQHLDGLIARLDGPATREN